MGRVDGGESGEQQAERQQDRRLSALIVDWGGVLTAPLDHAMTSWARSEGVDFEHFTDVMRGWVGAGHGPGGGSEGSGGGPGGGPGEGHHQAAPSSAALAELGVAAQRGLLPSSPVHALELGEISVEEFERQLAAELTERGSPVSAEGLLGRVLHGLADLHDDMLGLIRRAKSTGLRTGLLSNSWGDNYPEHAWEGAFDAVVISGRVGMRKPDPEIFQHTAELLGVPPAQCVMVDDLAHNVHGAVAVGMVGVLHRSYEETAAELEILFDRPLR